MKRQFHILWQAGLTTLLLGVSAPMLHAQVTGATFGTVYNLGGTPSDVVHDDVRGKLYLVNSTANRIDVFSIPDKRVVNRITVGQFPLSAAMTPDASFLYVTNTQAASLSVIDLSTESVVNTISLPARPEGVGVGSDGRALITTQGTGTNNALNTLLLYDRLQSSGQQIFSVPLPPAITTPNPLPAVFAGRPATAFPGRLIATPDGQFVIGMVAINQNANTAQTTLFVYEVASGTVLRSRTVTGQSTILSMAPDGSKFMAGSTLYDTASLAVIGQMNTANLPFFIGAGFNPGFNVQRNFGGSVFSKDGDTIYSAFNTAATTARPLANVLYVGDSRSLGVRLGLKLKETILGQIVSTTAGTEAWALSESGLMNLPVGAIFDYPILQPETTQVFLAVDECNKGIAKTGVRISNLGKGTLSFSVPNVSTALVTEVTSGLAPTNVNFVMEPGRSGVVRQAGTNLFTNSGGGGGTAINVTLQSLNAINFPNTIRVYMNFRVRDQRGILFPVPTSLNNGQGLVDLVFDAGRKLIYLSNSGFNRVEVFDTVALKFLAPIPVGQLPRAMAMTPDGFTLYVGNSGGESISIVDLETRQVTGTIDFPPIPRVGGQNAVTPSAMAYGISGLQFMMSNGTFWRVVNNIATPRLANSVTPVSIGGPISMVATPGGEYVLTMAGNSNAYLYDALADTYTASRQLYDQAAVSYFGALSGGKDGSYLLANGLILSPSLAVIGGFERPGVTQFGPPPAPGQPPTQTIVSNGQRNVASHVAIDENTFLRLTTPVRQNLTSVTRDDARPTLELVNIQTGAETVVAIAPENPQFSVFGANRVNVPTRQMVVDAAGTAYVITVSGLSVIPVYANGTAPKPAITTGARGIVNSTDGSVNFRPGSFITVSGARLANPATASALPAPTVLGGSCIVLNETPLPLLQTSDGQISAQIPETVQPGTAVLQVRSLLRAEQSDPVVITVRR